MFAVEPSIVGMSARVNEKSACALALSVLALGVVDPDGTIGEVTEADGVGPEATHPDRTTANAVAANRK